MEPHADQFDDGEIEESLQQASTELAITEWSDSGKHLGDEPSAVEPLVSESLVIENLIDQVIEEVPIALVYNGISHAVMMVTPTDLEAFALGFSLSESILDSPDQLYDMAVIRRDEGLEITMQISPERFVKLKDRRRSMTGRTGCGLCGAESLEHAIREPERLPHDPIFSHRAINHAVQQFRSQQQLLQETGAAHGAALCNSEGELELLCEDVGRHNAMDKLFGKLCEQKIYQDPLALAGRFVLVSSRASYELILKARAMGIGMLVAVSAPTSLAVEHAKQANIILVGFARDGRHLVYSHGDRVQD